MGEREASQAEAGHAEATAGERRQARLDDRAARERVARLDDLLGRLEQVPGRTAEMAIEAVSALAEVYGEALARVADRAAGTPVLDTLTADELVRHLFVLHAVGPDPTAVAGLSAAGGTPSASGASGVSGSCGGGCRSAGGSAVIPVDMLTRSTPGGRTR